MTTETGDPKVRPCRTPPRSSTSSCSNRIRGPRPYPSRRRANSSCSCSASISKPAGSPSTMTVSAGPCDSPAVKNRTSAPFRSSSKTSQHDCYFRMASPTQIRNGRSPERIFAQTPSRETRINRPAMTSPGTAITSSSPTLRRADSGGPPTYSK